MNNISLKPLKKLEGAYIRQIKIIETYTKMKFESELLDYFGNGWRIYSEIVHRPANDSSECDVYMVLLYKI